MPAPKKAGAVVGTWFQQSWQWWATHALGKAGAEVAVALGPLVVRVQTCSQGGRGSHWYLVSGPSRAAAVNACDCLWSQR